LGVHIRAVDIDADVVEFAQGGVYYLGNHAGVRDSDLDPLSPLGDLAAKTSGDQSTSVFERMSSDDIARYVRMRRSASAGQATVP
jgi:hypothetical protein